MINNEYNRFGENERINESEVFNEIQVNKIGTESKVITTEAHKTNEYGSSQKTKRKKTKQSLVKKLLQNAIESTGSLISTVATSAIVLVASVVMFSNLVFSSPNFELLEIYEGYDSVAYNLYASELEENVYYYVSIFNSKESYQYDIINGENINEINDLIHNTVYNFIVIGINEENGTKVEYFSTKFYTTSEEKMEYVVTWLVEDVVMEIDYVEKGELPIYNGPTPTKEDTLEYTYTFAGWDKEIKEVTEDVTYTAVFEEVLNEFSATYNLVDEQTAIIHWDNEEYNVVEFNIEFDNSSDSRLSYRIKLYDEETNNEFVYEGNEETAYINVPKETSYVSIEYELIGTYGGIEKIYDTIKMPEFLVFNNPFISFSDDLILVDTNMYQAQFYIVTDYPDAEIYNLMTLYVSYDGIIGEEIIINDVLVNEEILITLNVPDAISNISIAYVIDMLGNNGHNVKTIEGTMEYILSNEYKLERTVVNKDYGLVKLYFNYHFVDDFSIIAVKNLDTNEIRYLDKELGYIEIEFDESLSSLNYSYYLSDLSGNAFEIESSIILDLSVDIASIKNQYSFSYQNPGEVLITYNENDTINLYFNVKFETEDPSIYYSIAYTSDNGEEEIYYTESYAKYENAKSTNYYIVYYIYKTIDDVEYLIDSIAVSGGIEHINQYIIYDAISVVDNIIKVNILESTYKIDNTSWVVTIDGIDYNIDSTQIIYNYEEGCYEILNPVEKDLSEISITFLGALYSHSYNYDYLSQFITIMGNQYTLIKIES